MPAFATVQEYFALAKRDLAEMLGASVSLEAAQQNRGLRWVDPRRIRMRLPGGSHVVEFFRVGRVFERVESNLVRTYAETLDEFAQVPSLFATTASDDVLTAAVVARCASDLGHRRVLEQVLRLVIQQSTKTYEGSRIAVNVCIDFDDQRAGHDIVEFFDRPWSSVLGSGVSSGVAVSVTGTAVELLSLPPVPAQAVWAPESFAQLSAWTSAGPRRVALAATRTGEVYLFHGGELSFVRRNSRWRGVPLGMLRTIGWIPGSSLPSTTKNNVLLALVDASAAHHGACIGIVSPAHVNDALRDLVSPQERWSSPANPRRQLLKQTAFDSLTRRHRLELLSMDGATLLDRYGRILAAGAILHVQPGSTGGGRTAAAKMLGKYGIGIKVSQDGPVVGYAGGQSQEVFRLG